MVQSIWDETMCLHKLMHLRNRCRLGAVWPDMHHLYASTFPNGFERYTMNLFKLFFLEACIPPRVLYDLVGNEIRHANEQLPPPIFTRDFEGIFIRIYPPESLQFADREIFIFLFAYIFNSVSNGVQCLYCVSESSAFRRPAYLSLPYNETCSCHLPYLVT